MVTAIDTALSGLNAASKRVAASASNIANINTAGSLSDSDNAPYTPLEISQKTITTQGQGSGVQADFVPKSDPFTPSYAPDSPFADENGLIGVPNVNLAEDIVNLGFAKYQYEANLKIIKTASDIEDTLLKAFDKKV